MNEIMLKIAATGAIALIPALGIGAILDCIFDNNDEIMFHCMAPSFIAMSISVVYFCGYGVLYLWGIV